MNHIATLHQRRLLFVTAAWLALQLDGRALGDPPQQSESPLVKLFKSGRVPEARQGTIVDMIGKRGNLDDLNFLFEQVVLGSKHSEATRHKALDALAEAAENRKLQPAQHLERLIPLFEAAASRPDRATAMRSRSGVEKSAVRLAGLWMLKAAGEPLRKIAQSAAVDDGLRTEALEALGAIGGEVGRAQIEALAGTDQRAGVRVLALAALARLDVDAAAARFTEVLPLAMAQGCDLTPLMAAFLNRQGGADTLAAALGQQKKLAPDAAKLALRSVYALGHADTALVAALCRAAGLSTEVKPPTPKELSDLVAEVLSKGDAAQGEAIFRRADLNCLSCHSISKAGGDVGPDLSAIGQSSPADYIISSILTPDQSIKEQFHTLVVLTSDGHVFQGVVTDKDNQRVVLREANGALRTVPVDSIEDQKPGGSLMPKGLVNLMTRTEFVNLVRFLSELGKPGPYAIRSTPMFQRWHVLKAVPESLAGAVPSRELLRNQVLEAPPERWISAYAKVDGTLPLHEPPVATSTAGKVLFLQGEIDVSSGGPIQIQLDSAAGAHFWLDDEQAPVDSPSFARSVTPGRHAITIRIDTAKRSSREIRVEVTKPAGSSAEFTVVGGR